MRTIKGNVGRDGRRYKETLQSCTFTAKNKSMIFFTILKVLKMAFFLWKSHVLRSVNQESAKQEALRSVLVVIDWAMKFLQMKYKEKQSKWFSKRGLSWHII